MNYMTFNQTWVSLSIAIFLKTPYSGAHDFTIIKNDIIATVVNQAYSLDILLLNY